MLTRIGLLTVLSLLFISTKATAQVKTWEGTVEWSFFGTATQEWTGRSQVNFFTETGELRVFGYYPDEQNIILSAINLRILDYDSTGTYTINNDNVGFYRLLSNKPCSTDPVLASPPPPGTLNIDEADSTNGIFSGRFDYQVRCENPSNLFRIMGSFTTNIEEEPEADGILVQDIEYIDSGDLLTNKVVVDATVQLLDASGTVLEEKTTDTQGSVKFETETDSALVYQLDVTKDVGLYTLHRSVSENFDPLSHILEFPESLYLDAETKRLRLANPELESSFSGTEPLNTFDEILNANLIGYETQSIQEQLHLWSNADATLGISLNEEIARIIIAEQVLYEILRDSAPLTEEIALLLSDLIVAFTSTENTFEKYEAYLNDPDTILPALLEALSDKLIAIIRELAIQQGQVLENDVKAYLLSQSPPELHDALIEAWTIVEEYALRVARGKSLDEIIAGEIKDISKRAALTAVSKILLSYFVQQTNDEIPLAVLRAEDHLVIPTDISLKQSQTSVRETSESLILMNQEAVNASVFFRETANGIDEIDSFLGGASEFFGFNPLKTVVAVLKLVKWSAYAGTAGINSVRLHNVLETEVPLVMAQALGEEPNSSNKRGTETYRSPSNNLSAISLDITQLRKEADQYLDIVDEVVSLVQTDSVEATMDLIIDLINADGSLTNLLSSQQKLVYVSASHASDSLDTFQDSVDELIDQSLNAKLDRTIFALSALAYLAEEESDLTDVVNAAEQSAISLTQTDSVLTVLNEELSTLPAVPLVFIENVDLLRTSESNILLTALVKNPSSLEVLETQITLGINEDVFALQSNAEQSISAIAPKGTTALDWTISITEPDSIVGFYTLNLASDNAIVLGQSGTIDLERISSVSMQREPESTITTLHLAQNYPNPANSSTKIPFSVSKTGHVSLKVYDILGRTVAVLVDENKTSGSYEILMDTRLLNNGIYFYQLTTNESSITQKMSIIR